MRTLTVALVASLLLVASSTRHPPIRVIEEAILAPSVIVQLGSEGKICEVYSHRFTSGVCDLCGIKERYTILEEVNKIER